jgi:hypothetical protein
MGSHREAKEAIMEAESPVDFIHACVNDCMLFRGENADLQHCLKCQAPRYRQDLQCSFVPHKVCIVFVFALTGF